MCGRRLCYHLHLFCALCCGPRYRPGQRLCLHTPAVLDTRRWFPSPAAGGYFVTTDDIQDARTTIDREEDNDESATIANTASEPFLQQGDNGSTTWQAKPCTPSAAKWLKWLRVLHASIIQHQAPNTTRASAPRNHEDEATIEDKHASSGERSL